MLQHEGLATARLTAAQLVSTAWASASVLEAPTSEGANGARIRLAPQNDWKVNNPARLSRGACKLEGTKWDLIRAWAKQVSLADLIVLGGSNWYRARREECRFDVVVPFPGRTGCSQEQTDVESFAVLEPTADGFRNYLGKGILARLSSCWSTGEPADADGP